MKTGVEIVATKWNFERPMIFKTNLAQAHGRKGTFLPGFGVPVGDAVVANATSLPESRRSQSLFWVNCGQKQPGRSAPIPVASSYQGTALKRTFRFVKEPCLRGASRGSRHSAFDHG